MCDTRRFQMFLVFMLLVLVALSSKLWYSLGILHRLMFRSQYPSFRMYKDVVLHTIWKSSHHQHPIPPSLPFHWSRRLKIAHFHLQFNIPSRSFFSKLFPSHLFQLHPAPSNNFQHAFFYHCSHFGIYCRHDCECRACCSPGRHSRASS